jgi:peptidoglycan/LPS O-acetylase OafA/YrhL
LPQKRQPRWGLRTLGFLGLALLAMVTAISLGGYTFGTLGSLLFGFIGAAYCSVKGVRSASSEVSSQPCWAGALLPDRCARRRGGLAHFGRA